MIMELLLGIDDTPTLTGLIGKELSVYLIIFEIPDLIRCINVSLCTCPDMLRV
jgi:hypothetical protein